MHLKIRGGTVNHGDPSLCSTCRFATIIKGQRPSDEIVECRCLSDQTRITFPVTSCTAYADGRLPSLGDMEDIAWVLRSDPSRNRIGFVEARKLKPRDRYVLGDDWE